MGQEWPAVSIPIRHSAFKFQSIVNGNAVDVAALQFTCVWQAGECLNSHETSKSSSQGHRYIKLKVSSDCQPPSSLSSPKSISVTVVTHRTKKELQFWRNKYFYSVKILPSMSTESEDRTPCYPLNISLRPNSQTCLQFYTKDESDTQ